MTALPVDAAARALGVPPGTLRRWIRQGCPQAQRGRRGRGHAQLVDPDHVRQWRAADPRAAAILAVAAAFPEIFADALVAAWQRSEGIDKRRLAGLMAATWYSTSTTLLDYMRKECPAVPDVSALPEPIERLRNIARE